MLGMVREVLDTLVNPAVAITDKGTIQGLFPHLISFSIEPLSFFIVFNKAAQQFWGYSLVEVVGKNVKMLMPSDEAVKHDQYIEVRSFPPIN